jgi:cytochrome b subunit of formate dehydrogenase
MTAKNEMIRRFSGRHILNHSVMLLCFFGLALTGLPQMFPQQNWAKGIVLIFGGVERVRIVHHFLGTIMALQLVWHGIELLWLHVARRLPMPMFPRLSDVFDFRDQVRFNLGLVEQPPAMDRYTFAEKIEYLALVWGTALMVLTGLILLFPVKWSGLLGGEGVLAAKAAHGGEAILAILSILTWHAYFVHVRHWNKSMFTGLLEDEAYAEEHPKELQRIRRGEVPQPEALSMVRLAIFAVGSIILVTCVVLLVAWLRSSMWILS